MTASMRTKITYGVKVFWCKIHDNVFVGVKGGSGQNIY